MNSEMGNVKVKEYTNLVMVVNMKDLGVTGDIPVLVSVLGKMVDATKGTSQKSTTTKATARCISFSYQMLIVLILSTTFFREWMNGMAHGKGVETFPDGTIRHDGMWMEDEPVP